MSAKPEFGQYDTQFQTVVGSFQELRDRKFLDRQPQRIRLVKANGRDSLQTIFQNAGIAKDLWPTFAIMNGGELGSTPKSGQTVKILR